MNLKQFGRNLRDSILPSHLTEKGREFMQLNANAVSDAKEYYGVDHVGSVRLTRYFNMRGKEESYVFDQEETFLTFHREETEHGDKLVTQRHKGQGITFEIDGYFVLTNNRRLTLALRPLNETRDSAIEKILSSNLGHTLQKGISTIIGVKDSTRTTGQYVEYLKSLSDQLDNHQEILKQALECNAIEVKANSEFILVRCNLDKVSPQMFEFLSSPGKLYLGTMGVINKAGEYNIQLLSFIENPHPDYIQQS